MNEHHDDDRAIDHEAAETSDGYTTPIDDRSPIKTPGAPIADRQGHTEYAGKHLPKRLHGEEDSGETVAMDMLTSPQTPITPQGFDGTSSPNTPIKDGSRRAAQAAQLLPRSLLFEDADTEQPPAQNRNNVGQQRHRVNRAINLEAETPAEDPAPPRRQALSPQEQKQEVEEIYRKIVAQEIAEKNRRAAELLAKEQLAARKAADQRAKDRLISYDPKANKEAAIRNVKAYLDDAIKESREIATTVKRHKTLTLELVATIANRTDANAEETRTKAHSVYKELENGRQHRKTLFASFNKAIQQLQTTINRFERDMDPSVKEKAEFVVSNAQSTLNNRKYISSHIQPLYKLIFPLLSGNYSPNTEIASEFMQLRSKCVALSSVLQRRQSAAINAIKQRLEKDLDFKANASTEEITRPRIDISAEEQAQLDTLVLAVTQFESKLAPGQNGHFLDKLLSAYTTDLSNRLVHLASLVTPIVSFATDAETTLAMSGR